MSKTNNIFELIKWKTTELYANRNFIRAQVSRNLFGHYKNSYLGFLWNFLTPILYLLLSYIIYSELRSSDIDNYIVFLASGIFIFSMLTTSISSGGGLFTNNSSMIKKMYFPREILAISSSISAAIVMVIGYAIVFVMCLVMKQDINILAWCFVPYMMFLAICFYVGCVLLFGSIAVYVRDVQYLLGSMSIVFFVCTPIRAMISNSNGVLEVIYLFNPLTYFVEPMHQIIYFSSVPDLYMIYIATIIAIVALLFGYLVFTKLKRGFVERL